MKVMYYLVALGGIDGHPSLRGFLSFLCLFLMFISYVELFEFNAVNITNSLSDDDCATIEAV
jgi:hypothetical protein